MTQDSSGAMWYMGPAKTVLSPEARSMRTQRASPSTTSLV